MKAAIRCLIPRGSPATRAAAHVRLGATPVFAPLSVRALGSGPRREAPALDVESSAMRIHTEPTRPASPRHLDIVENKNAHLDVDVDVAQKKDRFFAAVYSMMLQATKGEEVKPLQYWLGLVHEARAQLTTEFCHELVMMYVALGRPDIADSVWATMTVQNIAPTLHMCTLMIRAWGRRRNMAAVDQWAERSEKAGHLENDAIQYACMMAWGDCGEIERVFAWAEMRSTPIPTPFTYAFLTALGKAGLEDQFRQFCHGMFTSWADEGQDADVPRLLSLAIASVVIRYHPDAEVAQNVFDSTQTRMARVSAAAKKHLSNNCVGLSFDQREARKDSSEVISAMMARYFSQDQFDKTLDVLNIAIRLDLPPTSSLCGEVLRMHATLGHTELVEVVWADMVQNGILAEPETFAFALKEFGKRKDTEAVNLWADRATAHGFHRHAAVSQAIAAGWAKCGRPERFLEWAKQNK